MRKTGIFDIDGTIFRSSLLIEVTEALIREGIFSASVRDGYAHAYERWLDREGTYEEYIEAVVESFHHAIKGVHFEAFLKVSERVVSEQKRRVYRYTRDLVKKLKEDGYYLLAISKSPKGIVEQFCKEVGFDKVYGFLYETDSEGKYTGEAMYADLMSDKSKILERAVEKEGLSLEGSVGVGDTESDIPVLEKVSRPVCFNPNSALYEHARKKGWKVVIERKDVIYEL